MFFLPRLLAFWCRTYCSEVAIQCWSLRGPLMHMFCVWTIGPVTYFSLSLWYKAFIVSLLFLNSCAYLWCFCEWCKYLSKKSLYWAVNYPLIFRTLEVWKIISLQTKKKKNCKVWKCVERIFAILKRKLHSSEIQLTLVFVTSCLQPVLAWRICWLFFFFFWFAPITVTNWWWCHRTV